MTVRCIIFGAVDTPAERGGVKVRGATQLVSAMTLFLSLQLFVAFLCEWSTMQNISVHHQS